jgi:hypothetical protein
MLTKDGIHTLINIVITNLMWIDLFFQSCATQRFVAFDVAQSKKQNYHDWHLTN